MIFYFKRDGSLINSNPSEVFLGSNKVNAVYVVAPFPSYNQGTARIRLPNGNIIDEQLLTFKQDLSEEFTDTSGEGLSVWELFLPLSATKVSGNATIQFAFTSSSDSITTEAVNYTVQRGVRNLPVNPSDENIVEQILAFLASVGEGSLEESNKVDKINTTTAKKQVYAKSESGEQIMLDVSDGGNGDVVIRKSDGNITAGTPVVNTDATNKSYVDNKVSTLSNNVYTKSQVDLMLGSSGGASGSGGSTTLNENYELIEKIIVGYNKLTEEPDDFTSNYTAYFKNTGTTKSPVYTALTEAETFSPNEYFSYSPNAIQFQRTNEPDGTPYSFKKIVIQMHTSENQQNGYFYVYIYYPNGGNYFMNTSFRASCYFINSAEILGSLVKLSESYGQNNYFQTSSYKSGYGACQGSYFNKIMFGTGNQNISGGSEINIYAVRT